MNEPSATIGRQSGFGMSAARLRPLPEPAQVAPDRVRDTDQPSSEDLLVWSEPTLARMDLSRLSDAITRDAAVRPAMAPGRSRLLYPAHWQSPYPHGNRYAALFETGTIEWLARFGLIATPEDLQTIKEFECGLYGGLSTPTSNLRDGLLMTQFVSLWLYFDDRVIEDSTVFDLDDPVGTDKQPAEGSSSGFVAAWNDLLARLRATQSEPFMQGLGRSLKEWLLNAQQETQNAKTYRSTGELPGFDTMLDIRTISIGMYPTFYLIEMAEGFELPDAVREHTLIRQMKRMASRLVGYGNDIGGLAKDLAGHWPNLVVACKEERGLSMNDAFETVIAMHNRDVDAFDDLERQLPSWGEDIDIRIKGWIGAVRYSVLGFTLWESLATRYQKWKATADGKPLTSVVSIVQPAGSPLRNRSIGNEVRTVRTGF